MISRHSDNKSEAKEYFSNGKGRIFMRPYFREEEMNSACRICSNVVIPPGASVGKHFHYGEEEIYIIVKGRAIVEDDEAEFELGPGDSILTGDGHSHSIRNETEEDLEFIAVINRY